MPHYLLYTLLGFIGINGLALFSLISYYAFVHRAVHKKMASAQQLISSQQFSQRYQRLLRILLSNKARRVESLWRKLTPEEQGKLRLSEIPNRLRRLTKRGPKWLKMRAIHLLGLLQDQQSIGLLRQLSSENDMDLALASVAALGRYNDEANARFLMGLISNRYRINSSRVASVLEGMQLDLTTLLLETLGSPDHKCRFWAATLLARFASEQTRTALVKLIDHDDPNTRAAALDSLSKIGDQTCKAGIIHALADPLCKYSIARLPIACLVSKKL
jgi:HEAT repeat protein